ncbi:peptide ABC transporter permease [Lysinibacillus sp. 2017]|uniref:ABC transporter permease n=1 Tax=unclassified Lysinibacillus TaxID=2636778 RepID=UPI000D528ED7|nr:MULTISPECIES: ABC transporter permease [unclassified Lysinibacillus]AWE09268.1 peptide ABC transporter permease [Lysinibacillus sp. 2017]TGN36870.1 ABC transporter permease [Lysinibacillus sp. S2017]
MSNLFYESYVKNASKKGYMFAYTVLGILVHIVTLTMYYVSGSKSKNEEFTAPIKKNLLDDGTVTTWQQQYEQQERTKLTFFNQEIDEQKVRTIAQQLAEQKLQREVEKQMALHGIEQSTYKNYFSQRLKNPTFLILSLIPGIVMYLLLLVTSNSFVRFIFERLIQSVFVIIGVATLVFTILYISPFDPARNLLGVEATPDQVANFNTLYGLDQPYLVQLWHSLSGLFTFDLGTSFAGKEDVTQSILNKFPVTLEIALFSLLMAVAIAIPVGIISAVRPNSFVDYVFMFVALIGLSIPSFWQGLIFILTFSLELKWFPATYNPNNWMSLVLPIVVLGTTLTASIARMTRSSMLEVINEDYIITAKAKGLSGRKVITKHAIRNAMIPIITVIGLLFGGMLGGASVIEKVFNISGLGSYIVDKQFIPDIPAILGGVVYIAITISIVNMIIDILYAFFDPRIRSKMKKS